MTGSSSYRKRKTVIDETVRQQERKSPAVVTPPSPQDGISPLLRHPVTATGNISVNAGRDVALTTATESDYHYLETKKSGGFLSKKTTHHQ